MAINIKQLINYWQKTAEHGFETMNGLFKIKRYSDCLFYGHIVLEKILKAHVVKNIREQAPRSHDLARLQELSNLSLQEEDIDFLKEVNGFNIRARYPEVKLKFYKQCTKNFTEERLEKIIKLYKKLCRTLEEKN